MITIIKGNLLDAKETVIAHQVNLFGVMGAGVAYQLKSKYPNMYEGYKNICEYHTNKSDLLGEVVSMSTEDKIIANMFCQNENVNKNGTFTNYDMMRKCFEELNSNGINVAIPYKIGCGIAGGDWGIVMDIIVETCVDINVTIYKVD